MSCVHPSESIMEVCSVCLFLENRHVWSSAANLANTGLCKDKCLLNPRSMKPLTQRNKQTDHWMSDILHHQHMVHLTLFSILYNTVNTITIWSAKGQVSNLTKGKLLFTFSQSSIISVFVFSSPAVCLSGYRLQSCRFPPQLKNFFL